MTRAKTLLAAAAVVVATALLGAALLPGALADRDEPLRPAHLDHRGSAIWAADVSGERVTLGVEIALGHAGGPARNVTVDVEAVDTESGMRVARNRTRLGTLSSEREYNATTLVGVPRDGEYRIQSTVYVDGERRQTGRQTVRGLETLVPEYARTTVHFQEFPVEGTTIPSITYAIEDVSDGRASLDVSAFLTNRGERAEGSLELEVMARQTDSNIVADRATVSVGEIGPGETHTPGVSLEVPDEYNYHLDAILRRDRVVVATSSAPASLDPSETVPENRTEEDVDLDTGEFATETVTSTQTETRGRTATETQGATGPGFTVLGALAALLIAVFARRYR